MRKSSVVVLGLFLLSFGVWALPPFPPPNIEAKVTRVVDGDTIDVRLINVPVSLSSTLPVGSVERIRYIGVQAPEPTELYGPEATALNKLLVENRTVFLELDNDLRDVYGRLLAYVYLDTQGFLMVNLVLIATPIIGTKAYSGTTRYSTVFAAVDSAVPQIESGSKDDGDSGCVYVGNASSKMLHYATCRYVAQMSAANRVCFATKAAAIAAGYETMCSVCKP